MLFAPSAKHHHAPALQEQLTSLQREHNLKEEAVRQVPTKTTTTKMQQQQPALVAAALQGNAAINGNDQTKGGVRTTNTSEDIVAAMMKLDAKLVAYLAGEDISVKMAPPSSPLEQQQDPLKLEHLRQAPPIGCLVGLDLAAERFRSEQQLQLFRRIAAVKLQMEALTLQPEGTKRMELLQSEIRPIFTIECQLSQELIRSMPRYDMFHIMQFESEKFQSLTQCTRFGQEAQRDVRLDDENGNVEMAVNGKGDEQPNFGRIHFTVWWREPGTCLNEMLGMGVLELADLYNASLLEQCKRISINRRGIHLASLYFKISLIVPQAVLAQCHGGGEKSTNNEHHQKDQQCDCLKSQNAATTGSVTSASAGGAKSNSGALQRDNNNDLQLESTNFTAETSKVRLLKGFICASESRRLQTLAAGDGYVLVCRRFWQDDEAAAAEAGDGNSFNYQEQFAVINDEKFLRRVNKQEQQLEVWRRRGAPTIDDNGNGNENHSTTLDGSIQPVGVVHLPLHQFYIAYRDAAITNHLCKGKLPVISIDSWAPIVNSATGATVGELKCLLAIGSEEQIANLKAVRGLAPSTSIAQTGATSTTTTVSIDAALMEAISCGGQVKTQIAEMLATKCSTDGEKDRAASGTVGTCENKPLQQTSALLNMLQKALAAPQPSATPPVAVAHLVGAVPLKPLLHQVNHLASFKFAIQICGAQELPLHPAPRGKKGAKRTANASKRFPPNEAPSTYVTFQADAGHGPMFKSHEGDVYATAIVEKSTQPQWQQRFRVSVSVDYLTNVQKRFILKIWKKAAAVAPLDDAASLRREPTPMEDVIIGFAALDLTVLVRGLHIGGCFNIVDFNGRINGQLEVRCQPLEDLHKLMQPMASMASSTLALTPSTSSVDEVRPAPVTMDAVIDQFESSLDLTHLNLGQAIKRKFTELEDISQRLRSRLGDITGVTLSPNYDMAMLDNWRPPDFGDDDGSPDKDDDHDLDEFEHDINKVTETVVIEPIDQIVINSCKDKSNCDLDGYVKDDVGSAKQIEATAKPLAESSESIDATAAFANE